MPPGRNGGLIRLALSNKQKDDKELLHSSTQGRYVGHMVVFGDLNARHTLPSLHRNKHATNQHDQRPKQPRPETAFS